MEIAKVVINGVKADNVYSKHIPRGIRGATVTLEYAGPVWSGLIKNVVFTNGIKTVGILNAGTEVYLPPEVVSTPGVEIRVGVTGIDGTGKVVIPTLWASLGEVKDAAPTDFEEASQELTPSVLEQLLGLIGPMDELTTEDKASLVAAVNEVVKLAGGDIDPETIATAVEEYLANHPVKVTETDPTVPDWAKQPTKPSYTAQEVGAVAQSELQSGINTALAQAKASGEFDGPQGDPGEDYVLTEADRQEIAELAAGMVDVPEGGAMQPLTFTGAVDVTYDGSQPVNVEIPQGGGGGEWKLIEHFTVEQAVLSYAIPLQEGATEYGIYWTYSNATVPQRNIMTDKANAGYGVMYRCSTNESLFIRVHKGPNNILVQSQNTSYAAARFGNGGTYAGSGTEFPAMTLTTNIELTSQEIYVYWR